MVKYLTILLTTVALVSNAALGQDSTATEDKWRVSYSGYFQVAWNTIEKSFNMPFAKVFIDGQTNKRFMFHVELRPTSGNPIVKAYLGYSLSPALTMLAGQLSNPFKRIEPQPENKEFVYYALYPHYVANGNDIGIAAYGRYHSFTYYGCIVNGTGRNMNDNNSAKDVAGYVSYRATRYLTVEACGQTGKQPESQRTSWFTRCSLLPLLRLQLQFALIKRVDLNDYGWYTTCNYAIHSLKLNFRAHGTTQQDKPEFTVGFQIGNKPLKCQLNCIIGKSRHPELAAVIQLFVQ